MPSSPASAPAPVSHEVLWLCRFVQDTQARLALRRTGGGYESSLRTVNRWKSKSSRFLLPTIVRTGLCLLERASSKVLGEVGIVMCGVPVSEWRRGLRTQSSAVPARGCVQEPSGTAAALGNSRVAQSLRPDTRANAKGQPTRHPTPSLRSFAREDGANRPDRQSKTGRGVPPTAQRHSKTMESFVQIF